MKKANILSVLLYGVIIFTLSCVPNNAGSASDKSSTKPGDPGSGTTTGPGSGTTTGSGSSTSPLGLKQKPALMDQAIYDDICKADGLANHIADKNAAIDAIDTAINLGVVAQRDIDIRAALAGKTHFTGLDATIIGRLPVVVASPTLIQRYFDEYLTDFGNDAAPLDIKGNHLGSSHDVLSDARCREYFGNNVPDDYILSTRNSSELMLLEYLAGQILTALSFPATRVCHYKDAAGKIKALYRKVRELKTPEVNRITDANNDKNKGGVLVNSVYLQPIMPYFVPRLNKWLVAETDYNNKDYKPYLTSTKSGTPTSFAFDFEHAGQENRTLLTQNIISQIYSNTAALTFTNALMTKEMLLKFIKQMKDFIEKDVGGSSVLSQIVNSPLAVKAKNDLDNTFDLNTFAAKIEYQIKTLIDKLEQLNGLNAPNDWDAFNTREVKRENLAQNLATQSIVGFDKKLFKLGLLGKYYLDDPSDDTELDNLITDANTAVTGVIAIEKARLAQLELGHSIHDAAPTPKITFSYPTNKNYCLIVDSNVIPGSEPHVSNYIIGKLNSAGWTLLYNIKTNDPDITNKINSAIGQDASLIVVGMSSDSGMSGITHHRALKTIHTEYNLASKLDLPRYIVKIGRSSSTIVNDLSKTALQSYYKNAANNITTLPYIEEGNPLNKDYGFSVAGYIGLTPMASGSVIGLDGSTTSIDALLQHMINNSN